MEAGSKRMPDYRRMYYTLCAGVSGLLDDMRPEENEPIYRRLEMLLQEAEDIYIKTADVIQLPDKKNQ